jgi:hypothetical protein
MTGQYLQLSMDFDQWIGEVKPFYYANDSLSDIWEKSRPQLTPHNTYVPFGADALIRQLQTNSYFKNFIPVQRLDVSSFTAAGDLRTVRDIYNFLLTEARASPLTDAFVSGIEFWLDKDINYAAGTSLSGLWNTVKNSTAVPYASFGVQKLITAFKDEEEFFDQCGRAQNLSANLFTTGSIASVGQFHNYLLPCA